VFLSRANTGRILQAVESAVQAHPFRKKPDFAFLRSHFSILALY